MSRTPVRIDCPDAKAEGTLRLVWKDQTYLIPYDTNLAGPDGCAIHFWLGENSNISGLALAARREADNNRDIVECTYSSGEPSGFWARQRLDRLPVSEFNEAQKIALATYGEGDYAHITSLDECKDVGDGLFTFLMIELADSEDCDTLEEAARRIQMAVEQLYAVKLKIEGY